MEEFKVEDENKYTYKIEDEETGQLTDSGAEVFPLEKKEFELSEMDEMQLAEKAAELEEKILDDTISDEERLSYQEQINAINEERGSRESIAA